MLHVRSYSVRLKRRNLESVSSFRRNLQRRKLGVTLSNASSTASTSGGTIVSEGARKASDGSTAVVVAGRPRSSSLTVVEDVATASKKKTGSTTANPLGSPLSDHAKLVLLRSLTTAGAVAAGDDEAAVYGNGGGGRGGGRQVKFTLQEDGSGGGLFWAPFSPNSFAKLHLYSRSVESRRM
ncbi:hypothetical protein TYRP_003980, partial [Tyrophagus putrescentiae]